MCHVAAVRLFPGFEALRCYRRSLLDTVTVRRRRLVLVRSLLKLLRRRERRQPPPASCRDHRLENFRREAFGYPHLVRSGPPLRLAPHLYDIGLYRESENRPGRLRASSSQTARRLAFDYSATRAEEDADSDSTQEHFFWKLYRTSILHSGRTARNRTCAGARALISQNPSRRLDRDGERIITKVVAGTRNKHPHRLPPLIISDLRRFSFRYDAFSALLRFRPGDLAP
jgi:hypothetical protein